MNAPLSSLQPANRPAEVLNPNARTYRIILWGPGHVGMSVGQLLLNRPEYDIVGARVYDARKSGVDIGSLLGGTPNGVLATTNVQDLLDLEADCVIHTSRAFDVESMTDEVVKLLESGKNVISSSAFHYPYMRGSSYAERLEAACKTGNSTLMGVGIHPSFVVGSLALPATSCMTDVRHLRIIESVELGAVLAAMGGAANELAGAMGFGVDPNAEIAAHSVLNPDGPAAQMLDHYQLEMAGYVGKKLFGAKPEEIRFVTSVVGIAGGDDFEKTSVLDGKRSSFFVRRGLTQKVIRKQEAYIGSRHFFTNENHWFLGNQNRSPAGADMPFGGASNSVTYAVEIHGSPDTVRLQFDASDSTDERGLPTATSISIATLLHSVSQVCDAPSGIVFRDGSAHCIAARHAE